MKKESLTEICKGNNSHVNLFNKNERFCVQYKLNNNIQCDYLNKIINIGYCEYFKAKNIHNLRRY